MMVWNLVTVEEAAKAILDYGWTVWVLDYNDDGTNYPIEDLDELASMQEAGLITDYSLAIGEPHGANLCNDGGGA